MRDADGRRLRALLVPSCPRIPPLCSTLLFPRSRPELSSHRTTAIRHKAFSLPPRRRQCARSPVHFPGHVPHLPNPTQSLFLSLSLATLSIALIAFLWCAPSSSHPICFVFGAPSAPSLLAGILFVRAMHVYVTGDSNEDSLCRHKESGRVGTRERDLLKDLL